MSKSPYTNLGSNIPADDWHSQKCDREREFAEILETNRRNFKLLKNMNRPTPETDVQTFHQEWDGRRTAKDGSCVDADFARERERQRDAAREERDLQCTFKQNLIGEVEQLRKVCDGLAAKLRLRGESDFSSFALNDYYKLPHVIKLKMPKKSSALNMNTSTPETDSFPQLLHKGKRFVPIEDARKLERERDDARLEIGNANEVCNTNWIDSLAENKINFNPESGKFEDTERDQLRKILVENGFEQSADRSTWLPPLDILRWKEKAAELNTPQPLVINESVMKEILFPGDAIKIKKT